MPNDLARRKQAAGCCLALCRLRSGRNPLALQVGMGSMAATGYPKGAITLPKRWTSMPDQPRGMALSRRILRPWTASGMPAIRTACDRSPSTLHLPPDPLRYGVNRWQAVG